MNENMTGGVLSSLEKRKMVKWVAIVIFLASVFLVAQTLLAFKEYKFVGSGVVPTNVITVTGEGEVFAVPDIASFTFGGSEDGKTVKEAQDKVTAKIDAALAVLKKDFKVEDKDVKTIDYSVYPKYDYVNFPCTQFSCPPSKQNLLGYTVNQTISIKVRNVAEAGEILGAIGNIGVTNISGLNFTVDDEDTLKRDARKQAIEDARTQANLLVKDLGVKLVRIVSFSESGSYPVPYYAKGFDMALAEQAGGRGGVTNVALPTGENKIVSNVTITYEIR